MAETEPNGETRTSSGGHAPGRILIACGGTGGHLFPGIAVAEELARRGTATTLLISQKQIDAVASEGYTHLEFARQDSMAMPSPLSPRFLRFLWGFFKNRGECRQLIREKEIVAVLGMGGFTSAAPLLAGRQLGLPTFIHESNAIPGRANRLNARFARVVLVGFEACAEHFKAKRVEVVGTPLRGAVLERPTREEALSHFGLDGEGPVLFVMGGSQGAHGINERIRAALPGLAAAGVRLVHVTGADDHQALVEACQEAGVEARVLPFLKEIQFAYAAADLIVARSGASSLAEIAYYGLPAVLIPYPYAADDHQTRNAEIFSGAGAAELWQERDVPVESCGAKLVALLQDEDTLRAMGDKMSRFSPREAAARVCDAILRPGDGGASAAP